MARSTPARSTTDTLTRYPSFLQASKAACTAFVAMANGSTASLGNSSAPARNGRERTAATPRPITPTGRQFNQLRQIMRTAPSVQMYGCWETTNREMNCQEGERKAELEEGLTPDDTLLIEKIIDD